jgi:hypothetical protein
VLQVDTLTAERYSHTWGLRVNETVKGLGVVLAKGITHLQKVHHRQQASMLALRNAMCCCVAAASWQDQDICSGHHVCGGAADSGTCCV